MKSLKTRGFLALGAIAVIAVLFVIANSEAQANGNGHHGLKIENLKLSTVRSLIKDDYLVVVLVQETGATGSLNGDSDLLDRVVHVLDNRRGTTYNTGLAADNEAFVSVDSGSRVVTIGVSEAQQGDQDLDGDGLTTGRVIHEVQLPR